jgi:hypothetical protein
MGFQRREGRYVGDQNKRIFPVFIPLPYFRCVKEKFRQSSQMERGPNCCVYYKILILEDLMSYCTEGRYFQPWMEAGLISVGL